MHPTGPFQILLSICFLLCPYVLAGDLSQEYQSKIKAVSALWEYEREEFIRLTKLSENQKQVLLDLVTKEKDEKTRKGMAFLLALNCAEVNPAFSPFAYLESYRCRNGPFDMFSSRSLISFENMYALAFVKEQDRPRAISFLKKYIKFWKGEATKKEGVFLGESDVEYLEEILIFLEKGGYH